MFSSNWVITNCKSFNLKSSGLDFFLVVVVAALWCNLRWLLCRVHQPVVLSVRIQCFQFSFQGRCSPGIAGAALHVPYSSRCFSCVLSTAPLKSFHPLCSPPPPALFIPWRLCCHGSCPALLLGTATTCSTAVGHGCPASSRSGDAGRTAHRVGPARDLSSHPAAVAIRGWPVPANCLHANTNCFAFTSSHVSRYHCSYSHRPAHERFQQIEPADRQAQTENGKRNVQRFPDGSASTSAIKKTRSAFPQLYLRGLLKLL